MTILFVYKKTIGKMIKQRHFVRVIQAYTQEKGLLEIV